MVVRGFDNRNRVEKTVVTEDGNTTEVFQFQAEASNHHQDLPDVEKINNTGEAGDLMMDVVFAKGQTSAGVGTTGQ